MSSIHDDIQEVSDHIAEQEKRIAELETMRNKIIQHIFSRREFGDEIDDEDILEIVGV